MAEVELKELPNNAVNIVGTLKSVDLEETTDRNDNEVIRGTVTIQVEQGDKLNNISTSVYMRKLTKAGTENRMYAGLKTVMNDYVSLDDDPDNADRVSVSGDISYNVYSSNGNLRENNRIRAIRFHRLTNSKIKDSATGEVTAVFVNYAEEEVNDEPTGKLLVSAFTVGYGGRVNKLVDLKVDAELGMQDYFIPGSTGLITFDIFNYVVVKEDTAQQAGFGQLRKVVQSNSFVSELLISGGSMLENDELNYDETEISEASKQIRAQQEEAKSRENERSEKVEKVVKKSGFGDALNKASKKHESESTNPFAKSTKQVNISDDQVPF